MKERFRLAKARIADNMLLKLIVRARFAFAIILLAMLCVSATAQENSENWMMKGQEQFIAQYQQAVQAYDNELQKDPGNTSAWIGKGDALKFLNRSKESLEAYQKALDAANETLKNDPQDIRAWQNRGIAMVNLGREDEAIESYEKAIEILNESIEKNPKDAEAWWLKAESLDILGKQEAAIQAYNKVIELNSTKNVGAWIRKAEIFFTQPRKYNESLQAFDKAVELMPNGARYMDSVWKENDSSIFITVWGDKDQIIRVSLGRHNKSTGDYDHVLEILSKSVSGWLIDKDIAYKLTKSNESIDL